jgi:hypothetical protein
MWQLLHMSRLAHALWGECMNQLMQAVTPSRPIARPSLTMKRKAKQLIFASDEAVRPLKIMAGAVVLEDFQKNEPRFAGLALPGDILGWRMSGLEMRARALVPTRLMVWDTAADELLRPEVVVDQLSIMRKRQADLLALRHGGAQERVVRLLQLLQDASVKSEVELPTLRDMSFITGIARESICRELAKLRELGALADSGERAVRLSALAA